MSKIDVIIGIDTSNYTTSLAIMNLNKELIVDNRKLLSVKKGMVGLRQSEALFQHIKELPSVSEIFSELNTTMNIIAISCATKPRPVEDSYMPVFLASASIGRTMSNLLRLPFYEFSHQEGHIKAGLWSLGLELDNPFIALHISGGTTEVLRVIPQMKGFNIEVIGGTSDISAGQFIDRVGVKLNFNFPAGKHMDNFLQGKDVRDINIPVSIKNNLLSFSGPETYVYKEIEKGLNKSDIIYSIFWAIGRSLHRLTRDLAVKYDCKDILVVGGVASNRIIKNYFEKAFKSEGFNIYFGVDNYCSDNAVGIAALGVESYLNEIHKK